MEIFRVDLYKYFGKKRKAGAEGYLNCYIQQNSPEYCATRIRPAMIVMPGGGYVYRSDRENECIAISFLEKGFNAFTLEYSLKPLCFPTQLLEGCMAVAYLRENAEKLHVDPEHICSIGFSAGGHCCALLATLFDDKAVSDYLGERASNVRPDAVILSYPVITSLRPTHQGSIDVITGGKKNLIKKMSLETQVKENSVPAFIWATQNDGCVPVISSYVMAEAYDEKKVPCELHVFEDGSHGLSLATQESVLVNNEVQAWLPLAVTWLKKRGFVINK